MGVSYNPTVPTNGLIFYIDPGNTKSYPRTGTSISDITNTFSASTLSNSPTYSNANGGIISLNGSNQYILVGPITSSLSTSITYNIWFKTSSLAATQTLWWDDDGQGGGDAWVSIETTGKIQSNRNTDGYGVLASNSTISTGVWYNFCLVANGASGKLFYLNGVLDTSNAVAIATRANRSYISIGVTMPSPPTPSSSYFNGSLGPFSVYNRALSANEVYLNFCAMRGRYGV